MEPPSSQITVINDSGRRIASRPIIDAVRACLKQQSRIGAIDVLLATDERVRELNLTWRQIDAATDVLSFPAPDTVVGVLGDIAIAVPLAERQAAARGVPPATELCYLAIHGALHLLGFDDETEEDRETMFAAMNAAAIAAGLPGDLSQLSILDEVTS